MAYVPLVQLRLKSRTTGKNPESLGLNFLWETQNSLFHLSLMSKFYAQFLLVFKTANFILL